MDSSIQSFWCIVSNQHQFVRRHHVCDWESLVAIIEAKKQQKNKSLLRAELVTNESFREIFHGSIISLSKLSIVYRYWGSIVKCWSVCIDAGHSDGPDPSICSCYQIINAYSTRYDIFKSFYTWASNKTKYSDFTRERKQKKTCMMNDHRHHHLDDNLKINQLYLYGQINCSVLLPTLVDD